MFDSKCRKNPWSLFRGEPSTSSNFQVPSTFTPNVIRPIDASSWPTSHCGKKVKRLLVFKLMQQHTNNWDVDKLFNPLPVCPLGMDESIAYFVATNVSMSQLEITHVVFAYILLSCMQLF